MNALLRSVLVLALGCVATLSSYAADYAREKRWADEVLPGLVVGNPVWLEWEGRKFLALYAPADDSQAAVLLVHGSGVHPDWGLVGTLRTELAERRFSTFSVQMPVLAADARIEAYKETYHEAAGRIGAALDWLRARGHTRVAVVSHSLGARMVDEHLRLNPRTRLDAWVAIGLSGGFEGVEPANFPILDLYGSADFPQVLAAAPTRALALKGKPVSRQTAVAGADHFFNGKEAELVRLVEQYLLDALAAK